MEFRLLHRLRGLLNRDIVILPLLVLIALLFNLRYHLSVKHSAGGFPVSDDSKWYLDYAYALLDHFSIGLHMNDLMYLGYNLLLTLLLAVLRSTEAILLLQAVVAGLAVILVFKIADRLFNRTTAVIASLLYAASHGIHRWTVYILSDSLYITLLLLCVYVLILCFESKSRAPKIVFAALAAYMLVFRPAGIITLAFVLLYIPIRLGRWRIWPAKDASRRNKNIALLCLGAAGAGVIAAIAAVASGKLDPFLLSLEENAMLVLNNIYATGWIYDVSTAHDYPFRPDFTVNAWGGPMLSFFVNNADQIIGLYGRRALSFLGWWVWRTDFGNLGSVVRFLIQLGSVALFAIGTIAAVASGKFRQGAVVWLVILSVFAFCVIFFMDVMYRYKAPSLPFLVMVTAFGAERLLYGGRLLLERIRRRSAG